MNNHTPLNTRHRPLARHSCTPVPRRDPARRRSLTASVSKSEPMNPGPEGRPWGLGKPCAAGRALASSLPGRAQKFLMGSDDHYDRHAHSIGAWLDARGETPMTLTMTDLFCGAGGSSTGAVQVPGVTVRIAANHWDLAVAVHNLNHPDTDHAAADLHKEDPRFFPRTDLLWASPECTKWSQANGKALPAIEEGLFEDPLSDEATQRSRLLMFDVLRFAEHHRYQVMIVENVVDIATQAKYRLAWHVWRQDLIKLGYKFRVVSLNSMHAQAFGLPAPQSRDRIYIACWLRRDAGAGLRADPAAARVLPALRRDGRVAAGVEARQDRRPLPPAYVYVHAALRHRRRARLAARRGRDRLDHPRPTRSGTGCKPKTRARIAAGIARYWGPFHLEAAGNQYDAADPNHPRHGDPDAYYRAWAIDEVLRTLHTTESKALAVPVEGRDGKQAQPLWVAAADPDHPRRDRDGHRRSWPSCAAAARMPGPMLEPAATFCAGGNHHGLVTPSGGSWNDDARPASEYAADPDHPRRLRAGRRRTTAPPSTPSRPVSRSGR